MGCGETFVKYVLFVSNLIFSVAGLGLLGVGVAVKLKFKAIENLPEWHFQMIPITAMVLGAIIFFIAFFGCCGAIKENNCMLVTYSCIMLILMATSVTLSILLLVKLDNILSDLMTLMTLAFKESRDVFHEIESTLHCCGVSGPASYDKSETLPDSCGPSGSPYNGCYPIIDEFMVKNSTILGISGIIVASVELIAAVFAMCLSSHVRNESKLY